jgi:hypothetical protein
MQLAFPPSFILATCASVHLSIVNDLTNVMCTPRERWMPEQFKHTKVPKSNDAHCGMGTSQSAHVLFSPLFE